LLVDSPDIGFDGQHRRLGERLLNLRREGINVLRRENVHGTD
jgi:hypothetical protein